MGKQRIYFCGLSQITILNTRLVSLLMRPLQRFLELSKYTTLRSETQSRRLRSTLWPSSRSKTVMTTSEQASRHGVCRHGRSTSKNEPPWPATQVGLRPVESCLGRHDDGVSGVDDRVKTTSHPSWKRVRLAMSQCGTFSLMLNVGMKGH